MKRIDEEERNIASTEHEKDKAERAQRLFLIKEELDTVLSNPNMII